MAYLDGTLDGSQRTFPWELVALEQPGLERVIRALVAHGLLATAVVAELRERGWLDDERHAPGVAAAIHRRFINRRRAVGPYAPLVAFPVGRCEAAGLCAADAGLGAVAAGAACAACGCTASAEEPLELHDERLQGLEIGVGLAAGSSRPVVLCARCHAVAHGRTPTLLAVEVRALAERAAGAAV